jgi:hypothetical protein
MLGLLQVRAPDASRASSTRVFPLAHPHEQGVIDYEGQWFVDPSEGGWFPTGAVPGNQCNLSNHGVNEGMVGWARQI